MTAAKIKHLASLAIPRCQQLLDEARISGLKAHTNPILSPWIDRSRPLFQPRKPATSHSDHSHVNIAIRPAVVDIAVAGNLQVSGIVRGDAADDTGGL